MALLTPICDQNTPSVQSPEHGLKETHHVGDGGVYVRALAAHRHLLARLLVHGLDHLDTKKHNVIQIAHTTINSNCPYGN